MALHLSLHRDLTQNEISIIMELPLGTVKTVINRGKLALRESLDSWNVEERK
jgi:DNA-directed RNA polymerase specialized sigma24 family protein